MKRSRLVLFEYKMIPKEGVIIECPQNGLFHDLMNVILTSWAAVSEMINDYGYHKRPLVFWN